MTNRWKKTGEIPSGWGHVEAPGAIMKTAHYFYQKLQTSGSNYSVGGNALQRELQAASHDYIKDSEKNAEKRMYEEAKS